MHANHGGELQEGYGVTENCKTRENSIFLRKGKTVILVKNPKFFYISDDETDFIVEIVLRNLATTSNFIEFLDNRNFMFFEVSGVG